MGQSIIIPNVDFSDAGLGKVTLVGNKPIQSLTINANNSYIGTYANLLVNFSPINTTQRGVTWSIISGSEYASINSQTGVVTISSNAHNSSVTVRATSTANSSIYDEKTIALTYYAGGIIPLNWIKTGGGNYVDTGERLDNSHDYEVKAIMNYGEECDVFFVREGSYGSGVDFGVQIIPDGIRILAATSGVSGKQCISGEYTCSITSNCVASCGGNNYTFSRGNGSQTSSVKLFALVLNGVVQSSSQPAKIQSFKVFDKRGNTLKSLVPVINDGVPCFMDEVNDDIYQINGNEEVTYG